MKKFREYFDLKEEIVDAKKYSNSYLEIYKNPDYNEWKVIEKYSRGIISNVGDLYIVSGNMNIIHEDIASILYNKNFIHTNKVSDSQGYINECDLVMIQMKNNNRELYLSESYHRSLGHVYLSDKQEKIIDNLFKKCKFKNPSIEFNKERISN